ncbi:MAG TPA: CPBP family intramembrane glutamic endopeptidase [Acidimicrobiales bacterium]
MNDIVVARRPLAFAAVAAGCLLLVARPPLLASVAEPVTVLMALFGALFAVGVLWPTAGGAPNQLPRGQLAGVMAVGVATFAVGRILGGGEAPFHAPASAVMRLIVLNSVAAVAEEAFFRRLAYGALAPGGVIVAVVGSAALFALVHVTIYGWWVLPLDLAAGLMLSWQRWAAGSWKVPAVTHVLANVLAVV